jgi:hypothetical protein
MGTTKRAKGKRGGKQGNRIKLKKHLTAENTEDTEEQTSSPALDSRLWWAGSLDFCFSQVFS